MRHTFRRCHLLLAPAVLCAFGVACGSEGEPGSAGDDAVPSIALPDPGKADGLAAAVDPTHCPGGAPTLPNGKPATWTILHYAAADNNLEEVLVEDINEMEVGHGGTSSVNIVVQLDRRSERGVWRYHVRPDSDRSTIQSTLVGHSDEEPDSGDWRTLASFGQWAATCYPADYYAVVIGGHGSGWSTGESDDRAGAIMASAQADGEAARQIAPDDSHGTSMYIEELARALREIRSFTKREGDPDWLNRLALYGSDACLMATFEVTYDLRNTSTYIVGSEETEPGQGWPYSTIVRDLTDRPSFYAQRPHELAKSIVGHYAASYGPYGGATESQRITLSAVDGSAALRAKNAFAKATEALLGLSEENEEVSAAVWDARGQTYEFHGFVDMAMFFKSLRDVLLQRELVPAAGQVWNGDPRARDLAQAIDDLLTEVWPDLVLQVARGEAYPDATGLSLYFPRDLCGWGGGPKIDAYAGSDLGQDTMWDEIVVQQVLSNGSGSPSYAGKGSSSIAAEGVGATEDLPVDCRQKSGELTLRGSADGGSFSATLRIEGDALKVTRVSWSVPTEAGTTWLNLPWGTEVEVPEASFVPEQSFQASGIRLDLQTWDSSAGQKVPVPTVLDFSCPELAMKYCVD